MKKIVSLFLLSLMTMVMAGLVEGAVGCAFLNATTTVGTASTYISGTTESIAVNITNRGDLRAENISTAIITISTGTLKGTTVNNATLLADQNLSNYDIVNFTLDTTQLNDTATYTYTVTLYNNTAGGTATGTTCARTFITDNTNPEITTFSPIDITQFTDGENIDFGVSCANTSSATLVLEGKDYTMTETSYICNVSDIDIEGNGFHTWYVIASDGLSTTTSDKVQIELKRPGGLILGTDGQPVAGTAGSTVPANQLGEIGNFIRELLLLPVKLVNTLLGFLG